MLGVNNNMNFSIETNKEKEELLAILKNNTEDEPHFWSLRTQLTGSKYFFGYVHDDEFKISRVIMYRNSFLPVIEGNIIDNGSNRVVNISMHYHPFVLGFMAIWLIFVIIGCIVTPFQKVDGMPFIFRFIPYFMLVFGALLFTVPYKVESNIAKNKLIELLQ